MFGNGTTTPHNETALSLESGSRVRKSFDNSMVTHVWAQFVQTFGQSGNGNVFFHGRTLFSYGNHYAAGYVMPAKGGDSLSRGLTLINATRYSVSTGRHTSDAWGAARGAHCHCEELTTVARMIDSTLSRHGGAVRPGEGATPIAWGKVRADLRKPLLARFGTLDGFPGEGVAGRIFDALGYKDSDAMARRVRKSRDKAATDQKAERAARKTTEALDLAKRAANTDPADMFDRIKADAIKAARSGTWQIEHSKAETESKGRDLHRAAKAAKAKGWTRIAAACRAVHKALRAGVAEYDNATTRSARLSVWARRTEEVRAGIIAVDSTDSHIKTGGRTTSRSYTIATASKACEALTECLGDYAAAPARVTGFKPADIAGRLRDLRRIFDRETAEARKVESRASERAEWAKVRAGFAAIEGKPSAGAIADRIKTLRSAESAVSSYTPLRLTFSADLEPHNPMPGAWRLAGVTVARLEAYESTFKAAREHLNAIATAEAARLRKAEAERAALAKAQAREEWRAGGSNVYQGADGRTARATDCPDGGAMLRARGVTRDGDTITGGTLETSQGADAPLTHAIRVFRFLKQCRDTREGWRANGKRLRVGHFTVDSVTAQGDFVAGCHRIKWAEVERLADALGVADLTPQDTTESSYATA